MTALLSISVDCGALLIFNFLISYEISYMSFQVYLCICEYAYSCASLVKASYNLPDEYIKEIT